MVFDSYRPYDWIKFLSYFKSLYLSGLKAHKIVELTEKQVRTLSQNNYLHLLCSYFGSQCGCTQYHVKRNIFKLLVNRDLFYVGTETDPWTGSKSEKVRSCSDLTKEEMQTAISRFVNWSTITAGIPLPAPEDKEFIKECQYEISQSKNYI